MKDFLNSYSYDTLSRLTMISQQSQTGGNTVAPKSISFGYNGVGDITTIYREDYVGVGPPPNPDPADSTLSYNSLGQLTGITPEHSGVNIDPLTWTFDSLGRVATFGSSNGTATYGYNADSDLTSVSYTGTGQPANESYSFDANGNQNGTGHVVSPANQVTNDGTFTYTFDNEGNRTSRTRISTSYASDHQVTYSWDYRNRLTDVEYYDNNSVLTKHVHFVYDVFDHLIATEVDTTGGGSYNQIEHYVLDVSPETPAAGVPGTALAQPVLMFDGNGNPTERVLEAMDRIFAEGSVTSLTQADTVAWDLADNLGSLRDVLDNNSNVIEHEVYSAFGQVAYESNPSVEHFTGFAGGHVDPTTGLVNEYHRWYDAATGRWLNNDPLTFAGGDSDLSRYVANDPTGLVDESGLFPPGWRPTPPGLLYQLPPHFVIAAQVARTRREIAAMQAEYATAQQEVTILQNQEAGLRIRAVLTGAAERDRVTLAGWVQIEGFIDNALRDQQAAQFRLRNAYQRAQMAAQSIQQLEQQLAEQEAAWDAIHERTEYLLNMPGHQQRRHPQ